MRRQWVKEESLKWVNDGIIDEKQREQIVRRYSEKDYHSLIFFFAAILIGLSCLTFVAANWQAIHHLVRIGLIIAFLVAFYFLGNSFFEKNKPIYGVSCFVIAIAIFGSGIFLSGQMYHYSMNSVFAFFAWGLVAFLIYLSRPHLFLLLVGLVIVSVGQLYGLFNLRVFDWSLFALFIIAYGSIVFTKKNVKVSWLFAIFYLIQMVGYSLEQFDQYYWTIIFILLLYIVGTLFKDETITRPFQSVAISSAFIITIIQALIFENEYARNDLHVHYLYYIFLVLLLGIAFLVTWDDSNRLRVAQLSLFFPVFILIDYASFIAYILLFVFSICKLIEGYQTFARRRVLVGTIAFLISTFVVYFQVAWDFLDKSLFFLVGGLVLFLIGFLLEKHRRDFMKENREDV
ncbi:DUF2157 domain-containing protein [Bacillaceae bacterium W0354]